MLSELIASSSTAPPKPPEQSLPLFSNRVGLPPAGVETHILFPATVASTEPVGYPSVLSSSPLAASKLLQQRASIPPALLFCAVVALENVSFFVDGAGGGRGSIWIFSTRS